MTIIFTAYAQCYNNRENGNEVYSTTITSFVKLPLKYSKLSSARWFGQSGTFPHEVNRKFRALLLEIHKCYSLLKENPFLRFRFFSLVTQNKIIMAKSQKAIFPFIQLTII